MAEWKLIRSELEELGACQEGLALFFLRVGQNSAESVYPNGWTVADSQRVFSSSPRFLTWLEKRGLVPIHEMAGMPPASLRRAERYAWQNLRGWKNKRLP